MGKQRVWLSLGTNLGERAAALRAAINGLRDFGDIRAVSPVYETAPVGELNQPAFLNATVEIETALAPLGLLNAVKSIENALGRLPRERWGPREIDIDLILWDGVTLRTPALTLPHPEFRRRRFVLAPLADIAPDAVDPETGLTVSALLARSEAQGQVVRTDIDLFSP